VRCGAAGRRRYARRSACPEDIWQRTVAAYIASPTNPQGHVLSHGDWHAWIELARLHEFFLFADECYSEIYRHTPPPGVLEVAARSAGGWRQVDQLQLALQALQPAGPAHRFAAGDEAFMAAFMRLRNDGRPAGSIPMQAVAATAWADEAHVEASRALYARKWALVEDKLGGHLAEPTPQAGFFLWLKLPEGLSDIDAAKPVARARRCAPFPAPTSPMPPPYSLDRAQTGCGWPWSTMNPQRLRRLTRLATLFA
jgi:N-succinyldiaminopimelate aminotransferase